MSQSITSQQTHAVEQLVLILDAEADLALDELAEVLPPARLTRTIVRYRDTGAPSIRRDRDEATPVEWNSAASGVAEMVARAHALSSASPVEVFVVGRAPLPLFSQLGHSVSAWHQSQTILNRRKSGEWDILRLDTLPSTEQVATFFDVRSGLGLPSPSPASGAVAVVVGTVAMPSPPIDAIRTSVKECGFELSALIELRTSSSAILDAGNVRSAANEIAVAFSEIQACYPHASDVVLFLAGPASLAYLVGRAVNSKILPSVLVTNFAPPRYEAAIRLPWERRAPIVAMTAEAQARRQAILDVALAAIDQLTNGLTPADLATLDRENAALFLRRLRELDAHRQPHADAFELSITERTLKLGAGLLDALGSLPAGDQGGIACLLLLHEVLHFDQNIRSTNYRDVGRAGFALEDIDYWADAFAIATLARFRARTDGQAIRLLLPDHIRLTLAGIEAFDRAEQGERMYVLPERRLRRYLTWHLQHARARTIRDEADADRILSERVIVELAPLEGALDGRFDKIVRRATDATELFVVSKRVLARFAKTPSLRPADLIDAIRRFDRDVVESAMRHIVEEKHALLVPWAVDLMTSI